MANLTACSYCGGIHERGATCPSKPQPNSTVTREDRFRWSYAWRKKRSSINKMDRFLCQVCLDQGVYNHTDLETHHIEKLSSRYDLRLRDDNLITLCREHHREADEGTIKKEYLKHLVDKRNENQL